MRPKPLAAACWQRLWRWVRAHSLSFLPSRKGAYAARAAAAHDAVGSWCSIVASFRERQGATKPRGGRERERTSPQQLTHAAGEGSGVTVSYGKWLGRVLTISVNWRLGGNFLTHSVRHSLAAHNTPAVTTRPGETTRTAQSDASRAQRSRMQHYCPYISLRCAAAVPEGAAASAVRLYWALSLLARAHQSWRGAEGRTRSFHTALP